MISCFFPIVKVIRDIVHMYYPSITDALHENNLFLSKNYSMSSQPEAKKRNTYMSHECTYERMGHAWPAIKSHPLRNVSWSKQKPNSPRVDVEGVNE